MVQAPPAAPSYSTASSCPNIQPLKPASCGGGRSGNQCWSRGVRDTDCPGHGLCCFDGCAYTCLPFNPKARQPIIHQEYGNKNKLPIKPKDPYAKKPIITTTHSNNNHYNQHDKSLESKKIHATNQHTKPYFEPKNSDSSYDDHQPDHHHQKLKPRGYPDHARPVNNQNLPNIPLIPMMMMSMNQNLLRFTLVIIVMLPQQKIQIQNTPNPKYINKNLKLIILNPNLQRMNIPN